MLDGTVFPTVRIHGSGRQASEVAFLSIIANNFLGMEVRVPFLTIIPNNPLAEFLLPGLGILSSAGLEILVPNARMFLITISTTVAALNWQMRLSLGYFRIFMPLNQ